MIFILLSYFIVTIDLCNNDDNIKKAHSLAMKEGLDQSRSFQLFLVGAENTGKTSLISSFFKEKFIEEKPTTEGADMKVCQIYCKDWTRISNFDAKQKHLRCKKGEANQKQQLSDYKSIHSYTCD